MSLDLQHMHDENPRPNLFAPVLGLFLIVLMLWPLAHGWMVRTFAFNPWEGFGAAMYCTSLPSTVEILAPTALGKFEHIDINSLDIEQAKQLHYSYLNRVHSLGLLAGSPPMGLAVAVFRDRSGMSDLIIRVRKLRLNPESANMEECLRCSYHFKYLQGNTVLYDQDVKFRQF